MDDYGADIVGNFFDVDAVEGVGEEGFGVEARCDDGTFGEGFTGD